ncbi:glycoprotein 3-alpha-L-fucosyltransferase A-like [Strongylocentrotus purpuratus]|uniref:Fucosyltransferase n=1 Tax=Strongylocentrotus purpuratus TaxID=7668 RepID=A0A7M7P4G4_STRPU|nr:glycoprotein 3-alpha-L-fucosyltransferase A-like [Strongylocentrotus purpuratus]
MRAMSGKEIISFCLAAFTCFSIGGFYRLDLIRYDQNDIQIAPPIAPHWLIRNASGVRNNLLEPEVNVESSSHLQNETLQSENRPLCYRQVQIWKGSTSPQIPEKSKCPGLECGISFVQDKSYKTMVKSDAIVFYHRSHWDWTEMQRRRPLNQAWVFYSLESPRHTGGNAVPPSKYDRIYNYTISYRPSSTILGPYGLYDKTLPQISSHGNRNWAKEKTGLVAWAASNCGTGSWRRYEFVKKLAKHVSVDMYGGCGNIKCPKNSDDCWKRIRSHKFYLAVENSECRDYITEKFWWNSLLHDIVPIVYGPPREDYERVAPPNSFIHLQDFKNFGELVDYIHLLDSNDTLYNSYFEWKRDGSIRRMAKSNILIAPFMCKVVAKVLDHEKKLTGRYKGEYQGEEKEHPSIHDFWSNSCIKPTGFPHNF